MKQKPNFIKYPQIPHLAEVLEILDSDSLQVFEKLDGGNCQIRMFNGRLFCGTRANFLAREESFRFPWFNDFYKWAMSNRSLYNLTEDLIIYGEFTAPHTLTYYPEFTNKFFLIDVYDIANRRFIPYVKAKNTLEENLNVEGICFLDVLAEGRLDLETVKGLAKAGSRYSPYGREGVVIKDYEKQRFAKLWRTSVNPTKEGLIEEITKTIISIINTQQIRVSLEDGLDIPRLSELIYEELLRSGRLNLSLAEISKTTKKVMR